MKSHLMKPIAIAIGMAFAGSSMAATVTTQGTIYMKFLDGNMNLNGVASTTGNGGDPGSDVGQVSELTLEAKAVISPEVTAGITVMSRCCMKNYWTDYGFGSENSDLSSSKYLKLRAAYVDLTPNYNWLNFARIGSNDWGQFDPFTIGKMRYTSRFNSDGFYFKGPLPGSASWEVGRLSLPSYLGPNYNAGSSPQNAAYIGQVTGKVGDTKLAFSAQTVNGYSVNNADSNPFDGQSLTTNFTNKVYMAKGEGSVSVVDIRAAYYRSTYALDSSVGVGAFSPGVGANHDDRSYKLDLEVANTPISGLSIAYQYFDIGAGFVSLAGARRESDVLLTEGSEAAWFGWNAMTNWHNITGDNANQIWHPVSSHSSWNGGMVGGMHQVVGPADNGYLDFDEGGAEQVQGWKGHTIVLNLDAANTPLSLEVTRIGYSNNWQNYGGRAAVYGFQGAESEIGGNQPSYLALYRQYQDRTTNILAFKGEHIFQVAGGLLTSFQIKRVKDIDYGNLGITTDDLNTQDTGYSFTAGNQVFRDLYASLSWGRYDREINLGGKYPNDKDITTFKLAYNLSGVEIGGLAQWISGHAYRQLGIPIGPGINTPIYANPIGTVGTLTTIDQYRMKVYLKAQF